MRYATRRKNNPRAHEEYLQKKREYHARKRAELRIIREQTKAEQEALTPRTPAQQYNYDSYKAKLASMTPEERTRYQETIRMRRYARHAAAERNVDPYYVYKEFDCLLPGDKPANPRQIMAVRRLRKQAREQECRT